jgi:hypothetical protein
MASGTVDSDCGLTAVETLIIWGSTEPNQIATALLGPPPP